MILRKSIMGSLFSVEPNSENLILVKQEKISLNIYARGYRYMY